MRTRVFTVTPDTWKEHFRAGVAGINDPISKVNTRQNWATRQQVMTEVAGIRPGDRIFFYVQGEKQILGGFEATTEPYHDPSPVLPDASYVNERYPFRVGFKQVADYPRPIHINEIWRGRDAGQIWTMQQTRGDAIGRHACWPLSRREGDLVEKMLLELNVVVRDPPAFADPPRHRNPLPFDFRIEGTRFPHLNYEATLQSLILEGLADGKWSSLFGKYDDFLPFVPTSEGGEIDVVLLRHDNDGNVIWYQLLELKKDRFRSEHLLQLLAYETWLTSSQAEGNPRAVHMVAVASRYEESVLSQVVARHRLKQKPVRLIKYRFDDQARQLVLSEISPTEIVS